MNSTFSATTPAAQHACVFGLGWGDEGKGKVVDLLCPGFDYVVRFNGGANAGHTVWVGGQKFALHLLPTGVLHESATAIIGPGVVVDPITLLAEIDALSGRGVDITQRLRISERAHLVLPYHKLEDQMSEAAAGPANKIGTTARGIGPCYADKMRRLSAVRFADLNDPGLSDRVRRTVAQRKTVLEAMYGQAAELNVETVLNELDIARRRLAGNVCDTTMLLHEAVRGGKRLLFEGANGVLLDIDHGTYPFVTSSSTGPNGIGPGAGVPDTWVTTRIGTAKAYATRVGSGPFVSELKNDIGDRVRQRGKEFGTTTGRPRRCGWFDAVACRYSTQVTGATDLALMHLDTLGGFEQVGVCVAYRCGGELLQSPPASAAMLERAEPVIEMLPGWPENLSDARSFDDLPQDARAYVRRIEELLGIPASILGIGPDRAQTIVRGRPAELLGACAASGVEVSA